ncbi:GPI inositol deacylase [Serendipita sp. 396]|nr:GPI inositol deacylase [Serendipita sp. 396]KAG8875019.1 GPI inositol deacylase [Serendipita sp. 405]
MYYFSHLANHSPLVVSPQGCEMSYMWPHYVLQSDFNAAWTPLSSRYSLWLYRESGVDDLTVLRGTPVLFIPGNAGSSRQIRSIASSAARQFQKDNITLYKKPLDFFAVEFNEDFSAIHPPTLLTQARYSAQAIHYIISLYPKDTKVILMGHSMGGLVSQLLMTELNDHYLRAVITMSTPSHLAPVRFDRRAEFVYSDARTAQLGDISSSTPLITICGGATDSQITSEVCALPERTTPLRRTIVTTSLQDAWTGVGHREMVWCHQVRSIVARLALSLSQGGSDDVSIDQIGRSRPLLISPPRDRVNITGNTLNYLRETRKLELGSPATGIHMIPLPPQQPLHFTLFSYGLEPLALKTNDRTPSIRILYCSKPPPSSTEPNCIELAGRTMHLPRQKWPGPFPADKGVNDDDHISVFEADLVVPSLSSEDHIAVWIDRYSTGWVVASVEVDNSPELTVTTLDAIKPSGVTLTLPSRSKSLRTIIKFPNLLSHSLLVYKVDTAYSGQCLGLRLPPLVMHHSSPNEVHYHSAAETFYLHSHRTGPFLRQRESNDHVTTLTIYSSGECGIENLHLRIAWRETLGRLGVRYWMGLAMWSISVVAIIQGMAWHQYDTRGAFPSARVIVHDLFWWLITTIGLSLVILSMFPTPKELFLGNSGNPLFAPLAFFMWLFACGLVISSIYILLIITYCFSAIQKKIARSSPSGEQRTSKRWILSIAIIVLLVAVVVPFQVAFMIVFMIQLSVCGTPGMSLNTTKLDSPISSSPTPDGLRKEHIKRTQNFHFLLLLTWLLPFAGPILVVWIRTLQTAGYTVPFDGDHNVIVILPWILLGEATASGRTFRREASSWRSNMTILLFSLVVLISLLLGPRYPFLVFEATTVLAAWLVVTRVEWKRS